MFNEWRYTEAMERCPMDGGDGGAQAFLSQPTLYWLQHPLAYVNHTEVIVASEDFSVPTFVWTEWLDDLRGI
jgi:hypothetical protein